MRHRRAADTATGAQAAAAGLAHDTPGTPLVRTLVRRTLTGMFGPPPFDPALAPGDPGLTGPDSASWRVIAEPAAIGGGIRGLLLQIAHPHAMAGVHDHSAYRDDPLGRLQRTTAYVTTTAYGSTGEALAVIRRVRGVHRRVVGTAPDGRRYDAADPHLLAWVSVALTSSFLAADRAWSPHPVDTATADDFVAEQSTIAALLDPRVDLEALAADTDALEDLRARRLPLPMIDEGHLPTDVASLEQRLGAFASQLRLDASGRDAIAFLRRPPLPMSARGGYALLFAGAIASLTDTERAALELDVDDEQRASASRRARRFFAVMRRASGTAPSRRLAAQRALAPRGRRSAILAGAAHPVGVVTESSEE